MTDESMGGERLDRFSPDVRDAVAQRRATREDEGYLTAATESQYRASGTPPNRFVQAKSVREVVFQAVGAGSACWVGGTGDLEFDSVEAERFAVEAMRRITEIIQTGR